LAAFQVARELPVPSTGGEAAHAGRPLGGCRAAWFVALCSRPGQMAETVLCPFLQLARPNYEKYAPPFTSITSPVMNPARSEARKSTMAATSLGSPGRFTRVASTYAC
jgi:hypothetical protein